MRKLPSFQEILQFLENFNIRPSEPERRIHLYRMDKVVNTATIWFGIHVGNWLYDCFLPVGEALEPGYEDSVSHYMFDFSDQLRAEWESCRLFLEARQDYLNHKGK